MSLLSSLSSQLKKRKCFLLSRQDKTSDIKPCLTCCVWAAFCKCAQSDPLKRRTQRHNDATWWLTLWFLTDQDHGAEAGRLSRVHQLRAPDIWLPPSLCRRYDVLMVDEIVHRSPPSCVFCNLSPVSAFLPPGDFEFAVSSDDNSEFWLSTDNSPRNVQLLAWVGRVRD